MLKTFLAWFDQAKPPQEVDNELPMTKRQRAVEALQVAVNLTTTLPMASEKVFKAYPNLVGLPMYRLYGALVDLAIEAGCAVRNPDIPANLGGAQDGDVLIVEGLELWVFDGDLFSTIS